jgi:hypothetical protein
MGVDGEPDATRRAVTAAGHGRPRLGVCPATSYPSGVVASAAVAQVPQRQLVVVVQWQLG